MRNTILIVLLTFCFSGLYSQAEGQDYLMALEDDPKTDKSVALAGTIRGKILDATSGEPLIGANVFLTGTTKGTITDYDGNFSLEEVGPGTVSVTASYISYETQVFNDVEVPSGDVIILNANLNLSTQAIEEVVITARQREQTEAAVLIMKKKLPSVLDGISSQQISRLGDSDAASALKRVTGVSVEGGKYVYVRGLSDRYSTTTLNGAQIPGLDPEKNTVQMDLFPSNIIENLMVYKTFSPDLPGNATGGLVNIVTKDFPERFTLQFSAGLGFNPQANLRDDFLSYAGGETDWLGMDDGTRDIPEEVNELTQNGQLPSPFGSTTDTLGMISRGFNKTMDNSEVNSFLDQSYSVSLGNRIKLFGNDLGFNLSANYSKDYDMYVNGRDERYTVISPTAPPNAQRLFSRNEGTENVIWSGLANVSYKLSNNHKIGFTFMRNQSGEKSSKIVDGLENYSDQTQVIEQGLRWMERSITAYQAKGKHVIPGANNGTIEWMGSYSLATQDEPDMRFFFYDYDTDPATGEYTNYAVRDNKKPARYYRDMEETNLDLKLSYSQPFKLAGRNAKVEFGAAYIDKYRTLDENRFDIARQRRLDFDGSAADYLQDDHFISSELLADPTRPPYLYYINSVETDLTNSYNGSETVMAGFAVVDLPVTEKIRIIAGARYEDSEIFVENGVDSIANPEFTSRYQSGGFEEADLLPSFNMVYNVLEDMNLRLGYNRTVARPVFNELAPYASYDFKAGLRKVGNPDLEKTTIDNVDIRWEWFVRPGEIFSVSGFYKHFKDPIEMRDDQRAGNPEITFDNIEDSKLYGLEFEVRKRLDFVQALRDFTFGTNVTLVKSVVQEDSVRLEAARAVDPDWHETRPMFGQSPFVINGYLNYHNFERGWDVNLGFNVAGQKLILVSKAATPDVYEQPFPVLDFNVSKQFKSGVNVKLSADNLLNSTYTQTYSFSNGDTGYYRKYKIGRTYSLTLSFLLN